MIPYPAQTFKTKKALKDAVQLAMMDVVFVVGQSFFGGVKTKKLSEFPHGEIIHFQGPSADNPTYFGRMVNTGIKGVHDVWEVQ